jgi:hypothetical protein
MLGNWQREYTMEDILTGLKKEMSTQKNRRLHQPHEGIFIFIDSVSVIHGSKSNRSHLFEIKKRSYLKSY